MGTRHTHRGNILFLILLGIVVMAALAYAVNNSLRGNGKNASSEKTSLSSSVSSGYLNLIENTVNRLTVMNGCTTIDYTPPGEQPATGDKKCFMFHPDGGGVIYQPELGQDQCSLSGGTLTSLSVGQNCGGLIYTGTSGGKRLYVLAFDQGNAKISSASGNCPDLSGATSNSAGMNNTNAMIDAGSNYVAARTCRALGPKWYLPGYNEMGVLVSNSNTGSLAGTYANSSYWTSTINTLSPCGAWWRNPVDNSASQNGASQSKPIRCVRND